MRSARGHGDVGVCGLTVAVVRAVHRGLSTDRLGAENITLIETVAGVFATEVVKEVVDSLRYVIFGLHDKFE